MGRYIVRVVAQSPHWCYSHHHIVGIFTHPKRLTQQGRGRCQTLVVCAAATNLSLFAKAE